MSEIRIKPSQVGAALTFEKTRASQAMREASLSAARRMVAHLANETDARGITDRGILKAGWRARGLASKGAEVVNDAPHAGIIELGARPHPVSKEGVQAIARWAARKLGIAKKDAMGVAYRIASKIRAVGQKPHYLVRDSLPFACKFFEQEMRRAYARRRRS